MTTLTLQQSCAESWGNPVNNALLALIEAKGVFAGKGAQKNTQITSKNKVLLGFAFAAQSTFRFDSDLSGEQAHV